MIVSKIGQKMYLPHIRSICPYLALELIQGLGENNHGVVVQGNMYYIRIYVHITALQEVNGQIF